MVPPTLSQYRKDGSIRSLSTHVALCRVGTDLAYAGTRYTGCTRASSQVFSVIASGPVVGLRAGPVDLMTMSKGRLWTCADEAA
eukprot:942808-Rhodomonas_salina.3